jgi:multiple sugar transport system substrate-binding protein
MSVQLKGMTWDHSRGFTSVVGVSQRFTELHPDVNIVWEKRPLSDFESEPIDELAAHYDVLVIDHPWAGFAMRRHVLLPLQSILPESFLRDVHKDSVGQSYESYNFDGFQTALPIDAASLVSVWRPDMLCSSSLPETYEDVLSLAKEGHVVIAGAPTHLLMVFYSMCRTVGKGLFSDEHQDQVIDKNTGVRVLEDMRDLVQWCPDSIFQCDPIRIHEILSSSNEYFYCPFTYGYVNYSRRGYASHRLKAGGLTLYRGKQLQGVLGGTGLAISARTRYAQECENLVTYIAGSDIQRTLYADCGGQPGLRSAWLDDECNQKTMDFFRGTLAVLDGSYVRPRYEGYLDFQNEAGLCLRDFLRGEGTSSQTLQKFNEIYVRTKQ